MISLEIPVRDFYERLWDDALADAGGSKYSREWFEDWLRLNKPDILILQNYRYLSASMNKDFLDLYAVDVQLNMRDFIWRKKVSQLPLKEII